MPKLGESIVEGTVARWLKRPGDPVAHLEPLLEISTDKIDTEIPSPAAGVLLQILAPEGAVVSVGATLATIVAPEELSQQRTDSPVEEEDRIPATSRPAAEFQVSPAKERRTGRAFLSPVVQRLVREHGIDLDRIVGSGLDGRITRSDILAWLKDARAASASEEHLHPLTTMRRIIAEHMVASARTSPHVTAVFEVDVTAVVRHRQSHNSTSLRDGPRLTYSPYFVAAAAAALRKHPALNSRFTERGIVEARRIHIGVAVSVPNGLLVPVIHDADTLSLAQVALAVTDLAKRARSGSLTPGDLEGGTFTITNHGTGGSLLATPIIHQPQSAILGVGAIVKRPVVLANPAGSLLPSADDTIAIRPMCFLSLSFDHRVLDGAVADAFLSTIKATLENWPTR
jgi:2-oxoglutarate dehydrogenase E2 component (dihydrolipoamide succinyltransferase)